MKSIKLFLAITFALIGSTLFSQTSMEEYLYVTKGYKVQIESGLDMKKGYEIEFVHEINTADGQFGKLSTLYRVKPEGKEIAAYMLTYTKYEGAAVEYLCIPSIDSDEEVLSTYYKSLNHRDGQTSTSQRLLVLTVLLGYVMEW